jgi:hypothetical protein
MQLDADGRLAAAAGGVARYFADAAGLDHEIVTEWQSEAIAACNRAFEHMNEPNQRLEVKIIRTPDRLEVVVNRAGAEAAHLTKYVGESASRK